MDDRLSELLDVLGAVRLLPHRPDERGVIYGYVADESLATVVKQLVATLVAQRYEVHRCAWRGEIVLLALRDDMEPFAFRLTSRADERYNLYALSRPRSASALWQWAQVMVRRHTRRRDPYRGADE
jgi:hypothetical protein